LALKGNQMKKFMVQQSNVLAVWSARIIKSVALFVVAFTVWTVCNARLDTLRNDRAANLAGYVSAEDRLKQLDCLTRNIYWEAASEPFEGKVAVAQVTLNRVEDGRFANTVCGVVYQKNVFYERVVCQFSWFCEGNHKIRAVHKPMWQESELVAKKVLLEDFRLPSMKNALYYHADYVNPNWRKPKIDQIGRHIFYGEKI
jgi:spore germination cell wall hydrolase CwlJ-like protein